MKIGSLFAGIGGFDLAGEWCGHRTIWTSEIDPYCVALLAERFPAAKQLGDISTIDWATVERPDILTGGFPCQDISYAGKGAGLAGKRSGLWYEYARAIREVGPRYVIVENVRALFTRGFDAVLGTLADLGYDAEWSMYGAADVGAPHRRHRVWILAYRNGGGRQAVRHPSGGGFGGESRRGDGPESQDGREPLADTDQPGPQGRDGGELQERAGELAARSGGASPDAHSIGREVEVFQQGYGGQAFGVGQANVARGSGTPVVGGGGWLVEPDVGRVAHGVSARVDRLRGLGNAIVPACALPIFRRIQELEHD